MSKRKEVTLTEKDYSFIKQAALTNWLDNGITSDNHNCKCFVKAVISFTCANGYEIIDGKIYEQEKDTK